MRKRERGDADTALIVVLAAIIGLMIFWGFDRYNKESNFYKECREANGIVQNTTPGRIDCYDKNNKLIRVPSGDYPY